MADKNKKDANVKTKEKILEDIKKQSILSGKISLVSRTDGEPYAIVIQNGWKFKIYNKDMDAELEIKSFVNFINRQIQFVPLEIEEDGIVRASRALAQKKTRPDVVKKIESKAVVDAQIVNILPHGAYVDVDGVTGLLKNMDYAADCSSIKDVLHVGDHVKVKFKKNSSNGTILFEAAKKYVSNGALTIDDILPDSIVTGVVRAVQPFGVFVQVVVGCDALCSNKNLMELEEDERVSVRITSVDKDTKRIRGEILPQ